MSVRPSAKAARFTESVIREMTRLAQLHGAVNLSQGFPDFAAPEEVKEAARRAVAADVNQYAITWGARSLRQAIASKTERLYGLRVDPEIEKKGWDRAARVTLSLRNGKRPSVLVIHFKGTPQNPAAWLMTTARNKAIDQIRRRTLAEARQDEIRTVAMPDDSAPESIDSLRLMFTCCHPALAAEAQVALTLKTIGGLSTEEIARSYFERVAARDPDGMMEHWTPGGTGHIYGLAELRAPDTYRPWFQAMFGAFPDMEFEVLDVTSDDETASVRWRAIAASKPARSTLMPRVRSASCVRSSGKP